LAVLGYVSKSLSLYSIVQLVGRYSTGTFSKIHKTELNREGGVANKILGRFASAKGLKCTNFNYGYGAQ
jgi:hypothetical protein